MTTFAPKAAPNTDDRELDPEAEPPVDPAVPAEPDPAAPPNPEEGDDSSLMWAGDLYEEGDESSPADSYAAFTSDDGVEAWLDVAEDNTLTGWLREPDGGVYRYSDPEAWARDVDGASMTESTPGEQAPEDMGEDGDEPAEDDEDGAAATSEQPDDEDGSGMTSALDALDNLV